jgi:hypothetical protein
MTRIFVRARGANAAKITARVKMPDDLAESGASAAGARTVSQLYRINRLFTK